MSLLILSRPFNVSFARKSGILFPPRLPLRFYSSPYSMSGDGKRQIEVSGWIEVKGYFISGLARKEPKTLQLSVDLDGD